MTGVAQFPVQHQLPPGVHAYVERHFEVLSETKGFADRIAWVSDFVTATHHLLFAGVISEEDCRRVWLRARRALAIDLGEVHEGDSGFADASR